MLRPAALNPDRWWQPRPGTYSREGAFIRQFATNGTKRNGEPLYRFDCYVGRRLVAKVNRLQIAKALLEGKLSHVSAASTERALPSTNPPTYP